MTVFSVRADVAPGDRFAPVRATLEAAIKELGANFRAVQQRSGAAADLQDRLNTDLGLIVSPTTRPGWTDAEYLDAYEHIAALDQSLVDQLATGNYHDISSVRGVDDVVIKSPADGTMQPVSLYVPPAYSPRTSWPLVIFLHGRTWTEADTLGAPYIRDLAQETGVIVAAPYAHGDLQYADPSPADVYETLNVMERDFNIDHHRVFLAGHSMGGFGVFEVGPAHADLWTAFMCISGSMTNVDRDAVSSKFRNKTVYVVSGVNDDNIPHRYSQMTVQWLRYAGIAARFYAEPNGRHDMATIRKSISAAWHDMLDGKTTDSGAVGAENDQEMALPAPVSTPPMKPSSPKPSRATP